MGEKMYEEMFFSDEIAEATEHPKVLRARNGGQDASSDLAIGGLIEAALRDTSDHQLRLALKELVPGFTHGEDEKRVVAPPPRRGRPSGEMRVKA